MVSATLTQQRKPVYECVLATLGHCADQEGGAKIVVARAAGKRAQFRPDRVEPVLEIAAQPRHVECFLADIEVAIHQGSSGVVAEQMTRPGSAFDMEGSEAPCLSARAKILCSCPICAAGWYY